MPPRESGDAVPTPQAKEKLWTIHGKVYDLNSFAKNHPGGVYNLMLGKGRDCTELFESVHPFSDRARAILSKHYVKDADEPEVFSWEKDGFYSTLNTRVRAYFKDGKANYKAGPLTWAKIASFAIFYAITWTHVLSGGSSLWALLAGTLICGLGFCLMHDGSHGALSKKSHLNFLGALFANWLYWDHWIWLQHHVYGHHSYTGILRKDPDVSNSRLFLAKVPGQQTKPFMKYQQYYIWPLLTVLPNQHLGQALQYYLSTTRQRIFGLPTMVPSEIRANIDNAKLVTATAVFVQAILPFICLPFMKALTVVFLFHTALGFLYFANVAPNHDQEDTMVNHPSNPDGTKIDWGEQQVRCSGDHSTSGSAISVFVTELFGGMNYQIEHHLFPAVCHTHLRHIAPIVEETCKEFNIPYNAKNNWFQAMGSFQNWLAFMSESVSSKSH